ncbi:MAG: M20/M25/M40 family metallo-hydrolase [Planctomycetota bacterium]|nr:M20/M25/M40 family metallo-hydrolase [Planctomycetota bacterium]
MTTASLLVLLLATETIDPAAAARKPDAATLASFHELLASEPHVAGTAGDARTIARLRDAFVKMGEGVPGWTVEVQEIHPLLSRPVKAKLEIVGVDLAAPEASAPPRRGVLPLAVTEPNLAVDPATAHPDLDIAWNAWSGSGTVEAGVVYVNYGRREDFEQLAKLGVDPRGRIAIARYGGNFRGYKAKFAEAAGCVGLVIFTDPADSGFVKGKTWPDGGGWANADCVQRGSLITLPYIGDPLTPGREATKDAARVPLESLALPRIPVQPIGYGAAREILSRMKGAESPKEWRGGLPCDYRLDDAELKLHLSVEQTREIMQTANVIARLEGATRPGESVIVGAHHDAWCFGAADPLAGTICMLEAARTFASLARDGTRPDRTLVFAAWGAEEYGIFGSTEFVERDAAALSRGAVAYINLDMTAMGLNPGGAVSPTLRDAVAKALASAPDATGNATALSAWAKGENGAPRFGDLGGGSDHVAFWCHAGVPSIMFSAGGSAGVSYHSNYDTVAWYRAIVGEDYASARLVTGIVNSVVATLADAGTAHISATALVDDGLAQAANLRELAKARNLGKTGELADTLLDTILATFRSMRGFAAKADARIAAEPRATDGADLWSLRTTWMSEQGLDGRPWFRNLLAATDRDSGYATSTWPLLREAILDAKADDPASRQRIMDAAGAYLEAQAATYAVLDRLLAPEASPNPSPRESAPPATGR